MPQVDLLQWIVLGTGGVIGSAALGWLMKRVTELAILQTQHEALKSTLTATESALGHRIDDLKEVLDKQEQAAERRIESESRRDEKLFGRAEELTRALNKFSERVGAFEATLETVLKLARPKAN